MLFTPWCVDYNICDIIIYLECVTVIDLVRKNGCWRVMAVNVEMLTVYLLIKKLELIHQPEFKKYINDFPAGATRSHCADLRHQPPLL